MCHSQQPRTVRRKLKTLHNFWAPATSIHRDPTHHYHLSSSLSINNCNLVIMKSTIISMLLACCLCLFSVPCNGFVTRPSQLTYTAPSSVGARVTVSPVAPSSTSSSSTSLNVFGNRKSQAAQKSSPESEKYWQGEWVCKDCGYIYNRVSRTNRMWARKRTM